MAPERVRGLPVDERTLVYEVGAVLHLLLTGNRALQRESDLGTAEAVLRDSAPPPSKVRSGISEAMDRVITRAMEKDPSRRFSSMAELIAALQTLGSVDEPDALRRAVRRQTALTPKPPRLAPFVR